MSPSLHDAALLLLQEEEVEEEEEEGGGGWGGGRSRSFPARLLRDAAWLESGSSSQHRP